MNLPTLRSLQQRIREATGPDREIDAAISAALRYYDDSSIPWGGELIAPDFTTDPDGLGACVGLMREVLPGHEWEREFRNFGIYNIRTSDGSWHETGYSTKPLANDCLTFLDAICAALIAEEEAKLTEKAG